MAARKQPVELHEAREFLNARFDDRVSGVAELGAGAWSRAFSFELDGREHVARFGQHREDFEADQAAMDSASRDLPVPAVTEIGEALDGAYAISERYRGVFLESLDQAGWKQILPALFRGLDALREHPTTWPSEWTTEHAALADGPSGFWGAQLLGGLVDTPGNRVSGWRAVLEQSAELDALFNTALRRFSELLTVCPTTPHLIHADLLNRNVLVSDDACRLVAVFDWGCLKYGDFVYELAWFTFWAPWHPALAAIDIRSAALDHYNANGLPVPGFDQRLRCYELHIGLDHLAYNAFTGNTDELQAVARRTNTLLNET
jgi:hygromycin-B 4-O-kinase